MAWPPLIGVVLAGFALVLLSGFFLWVVHFRERKGGGGRASAFWRVSLALRNARERLAQRKRHVRLNNSKEFVAAGTVNGNCV
jgi:hypothetical protein